MEYLVWKTAGKRQKRAHIWKDGDTVCRQASTGGLKRTNYVVSDDAQGREICFLCQTVTKKQMLIEPQKNIRRIPQPTLFGQ